MGGYAPPPDGGEWSFGGYSGDTRTGQGSENLASATANANAGYNPPSAVSSANAGYLVQYDPRTPTLQFPDVSEQSVAAAKAAAIANPTYQSIMNAEHEAALYNQNVIGYNTQLHNNLNAVVLTADQLAIRAQQNLAAQQALNYNAVINDWSWDVGMATAKQQATTGFSVKSLISNPYGTLRELLLGAPDPQIAPAPWNMSAVDAEIGITGGTLGATMAASDYVGIAAQGVSNDTIAGIGLLTSPAGYAGAETGLLSSVGGAVSSAAEGIQETIGKNIPMIILAIGTVIVVAAAYFLFGGRRNAGIS